MNATQQQHPSPERLLDFAHGHLRGQAFDEIEQHLHTCDACCQWMAQQPDNTLLALARDVATLSLRTSRVPPDLAPGEIPAALKNHPRYRVIEPIGIGGMGSVYRAEHRLMHRTVALKIVHPWLLSNAQAVDRFEREVRVAAQLSHPNIVVSYDADQAENLHFLVMEFVVGETLSERVARQGPATVEQACDWTRQAAAGLQHAHERGMAHRDIKPQNLMIASDGQLKILDFGLSRLVSDHSPPVQEGGRVAGLSPTHSGMILGTPDYIAPEQIADSRTADIRSDIYSLGCTLYFLLAGRPPFVEDSVVATLHAHEKSPIPRLDQIRGDVPVELHSILARMTAKRPADRYATPDEVEHALLPFTSRAGTDVSAPPLPTPPPPPVAAALPSPKRPTQPRPIAARKSPRWLIGIGGAVAVLLLLVGAAWSYLSPLFATHPPARMLVMLPSQGLWFPDYQQLAKAADGTTTELVFASAASRPSELVMSSPPGIAVPDVKLGPGVRAEDYDAIIFIGYDTGEFLPGGAAGADAARLINEFQLQKKVVASLCAGQRVLAQHGALRGKQVAPCASVKLDEITYEGGTLTDRAVVADGLVVTASDAKDAPQFLQAIKKTRRP